MINQFCFEKFFEKASMTMLDVQVSAIDISSSQSSAIFSMNCSINHEKKTYFDNSSTIFKPQNSFDQ